MQGVLETDLAKLHSTMQAIEFACSSIQMHANPAEAEATILSLCQSPQPYHVCQFILENSQVANARFQAAAAIRDAAIREWGFLPADKKRSLISFCLRFVMQHAKSDVGYVQAKVSSVAAQMMKRGWLEFTVAEKEAFFYEVKQAVLGVHGVDVQFIGINFLEFLVSEFSPSTSTTMGLPKEFHDQCQISMDLYYLKTFYCWAQDAALSVTNRIIESDSEVPEVKVCTVALRLMLQTLNWDFHAAGTRNSIHDAGGQRDNGSIKRSEFNLVQPGPSWHDVLLSSGHVEWLLKLYSSLRQKFSPKGYWLDCPLAVSARKLIVQFCSLTGTIFLSDNRKMHEHHLILLLSGIVQWIDPPAAVCKAIESGKSESEMLDGCRALLSLATVTSSSVFDQLLKSLRPFSTISLLSSLTCEVVKDLIVNYTEEETWSWVARDILLDTWTTLLTPTRNTVEEPLLPREGINAAASVFASIVEAELKLACSSAFNDESDTDYLRASVSAMDERLSAYALIARAAIEFTIPFLTRLFYERQQILQVRRTTCSVETLEELYSLLLIIGHVIADEGEGEVPLVPNAIQTHFLDIPKIDEHPLIILSSLILGFAQQCLDLEMRTSTFSPRLMEAVIWFLARWSCTYLMPSLENVDIKSSLGHSHDHQLHLQDNTKAFLSFFGEHNQGKLVLDVIVRIAKTTLTAYPGEKDLQASTCYQLLPVLVRRKDVRLHLVALGSWLDLANTFANSTTFFSLNASHQCSLAQTLVHSVLGMKTPESSHQYVLDLMGHVRLYLLDLCSKNDLKKVAQQPDVIMLVSCMFERLRGAASASEPRTQKAIFEIGFSVMNSVLILIEVYKHEFSVVYLLLKFVAEWVEGQISYLEAQQTNAVVNFCMQLLHIYSSHNIGKISLLSGGLLSEAKTEKYKDLRAFLHLLTSLCSKDLVDFSSESTETHGTNISQVVYVGLHIITPLISLELLKYPKLCHDYFTLLSHMLEVYPEMVAQLNSESLNHIMGTLDFGIHHQDIEVVGMCMGALKALSSYHYKETIVGKTGLGSHATAYTDVDGTFKEGIFSRFLRLLLQFLLFEDYSTDLISAAADALLPLILCEQGQYQIMCNELIERLENPTFRLRLENALHCLTSSNQLSSTLDRTNYQRFRKNLHNFLIEVRGFLRTV